MVKKKVHNVKGVKAYGYFNPQLGSTTAAPTSRII